MWNKLDHKKRMMPHANKVVAHFQSRGINVEEMDSHENIIFTDKSTGKVAIISHHSFYRYTGIAVVSRDLGEKNQTEYVPVTDADYMNNFMKPIIETLLHLK